jgi:preprotein translocase subunit SecG
MLEIFITTAQIISCLAIIVLMYFRPFDDELGGQADNPFNMGAKIPTKLFLPIDKVIACFVAVLFITTIANVRIQKNVHSDTTLTVEKVQQEKEGNNNTNTDKTKNSTPIVPTE